MSKFGNLRLVKGLAQMGEMDLSKAEFLEEADTDPQISLENESASESEGENSNAVKDIEITSETVMFMDPDTLLKMLLGFHKAKEGSDYEVATRKIRALFIQEALRRMQTEYKYRGCLHIA